MELDKRPLTPTQKRILSLMHEHGAAAFFGGTRKFSWELTAYGLVIHAYQDPEMFLKCRGFIQQIDTNAPGRWYRLTHTGTVRPLGIKRHLVGAKLMSHRRKIATFASK